MDIFIVMVLIITLCAIYAAKAAVLRPKAKLAGLCFMDQDNEDDSDIKIAGEEPSEDEEKAVETQFSELEIHRKNGNLEKARSLGAALAQKLISHDGESSFGEDVLEDANLRKQRRLLLAFAVINTVETNIKSQILQGVVINVFYDTLKTSMPEFYDDIGKSGSFSFYTLCARRGGDVDTCIGQTFAMLADKSGDSVVEELGKALYMRFVDVTLNTIKSFNLIQ